MITLDEWASKTFVQHSTVHLSFLYTCIFSVYTQLALFLFFRYFLFVKIVEIFQDINNIPRGSWFSKDSGYLDVQYYNIFC